MEDAFSAEADGCSTSQQIPCLLQNLKSNCHVQRTRPTVSIIAQTNPDHSSHLISSRSTWTLLMPGCIV